jgi:hypothetical protein
MLMLVLMLVLVLVLVLAPERERLDPAPAHRLRQCREWRRDNTTPRRMTRRGPERECGWT